MSETPLLALPVMEAAQAQKHVTHNEALQILDGTIHLSILSRTLSHPPASPANGDRYLVAASPTGSWAGKSGRIALCQAGGWVFSTPRTGWRLWAEDEEKFLLFDGTQWRELQGSGDLSNVGLLGINATADTGNRLTVSSPAVLFNHAGGDQQVKINKQSAADTASVLFQSGFAGRAEMGLAGDNDFHVKVSADGSTWKEAIVIDRSSGAVSLPNSWLPGGDHFATRAELVALVGGGGTRASGTISWAAGMAYRWQAGATEIPDLPGLIPMGEKTPNHFGAVIDGVADDSAAVTAAEAQAPYFVPRGTLNAAAVAQSALRGPIRGDGQIRTSDGNRRAPNFAAIAAPPASFGDYSSVLTFFNGDLSKVQRAVEHRITGSATLGNPTSGYKITPETAPDLLYVFMQNAGHNEATSTNTGRTGGIGRGTWVSNAGQGDLIANYVSAFVQGAKPGATSFLANPAAGMFGGNIGAGSNGVYLNPIEILMQDNGYDVAGIGPVINLQRTNDTNALFVAWHGMRVQSIGTKRIDSAYFASGPMRAVVDGAHADTLSVVARKADQWNHFNVTPDPDSFKKRPTLTEYKDGFAAATQTYDYVINGVTALKIGETALTAGGNLTVTGNLTVNGSAAIPYAPSGGIAATTVAGAIAELDAEKLALAGGTMTGKLTLQASASGGAGLNVGNGANPSAPVAGDLWGTASNLRWQVASGTLNVLFENSAQTVSVKKTFAASIAGGAIFALTPGADPSAPVNGDIWTTATELKARLNGATVSFAQAGHGHSAADVTDFAEAVDDRVAALLVAGSGVTLTYNDAANTLTVAATGGGGGGLSLGQYRRFRTMERMR